MEVEGGGEDGGRRLTERLGDGADGDRAERPRLPRLRTHQHDHRAALTLPTGNREVTPVRNRDLPSPSYREQGSDTGKEQGPPLPFL